MPRIPTREQAEALLQGAERHKMDLPPSVHKEILDTVRLQLGLTG